MRVAVAGWFGSDNLGDEILLHSLVDCVRTAAPAARIVVLAPDPGRVRELHDVDALAFPTLRGGGAARRHGAVRRVLRGADLLVLGPGTVFQERSPHLAWPGTLPLFARLVALARSAGTPVAALGVGVREGGTPAGRLLLRGLGRACAAIGVRDARTAAVFGRRARVIGDLAHALPLPPPGPAPGQRFAVSLRPLGGAEVGLAASLSELVVRLGADGWSGEFLPMAFGRGATGEDDRAAGGPDLPVAPNPLADGGRLGPGLDRWLRNLAGYGLVVGVRLHAVLMAVALGVPTVAIAYERKVADAFADLGLARFVVDPTADAATLHRAALAATTAGAEFAAARERVATAGRAARAFVASTVEGTR
jgi:polysaccharide pyruvyl transferase WcaK-like protein